MRALRSLCTGQAFSRGGCPPKGTYRIESPQKAQSRMDENLYDEFGNYIGPALDEEEEEEEESRFEPMTEAEEPTGMELVESRPESKSGDCKKLILQVLL